MTTLVKTAMDEESGTEWISMPTSHCGLTLRVVLYSQCCHIKHNRHLMLIIMILVQHCSIANILEERLKQSDRNKKDGAPCASVRVRWEGVTARFSSHLHACARVRLMCAHLP